MIMDVFLCLTIHRILRQARKEREFPYQIKYYMKVKETKKKKENTEFCSVLHKMFPSFFFLHEIGVDMLRCASIKCVDAVKFIIL